LRVFLAAKTLKSPPEVTADFRFALTAHIQKFVNLTSSVVDPHHDDADPDPACHFDTDAYPDPDPTFYFDAVPDPDPSFQIKVQNLEKVLK
jgi:hypothetical protein